MHGARVVCCPKKTRIIMFRLTILSSLVFALPCLASTKHPVLRAGAAAVDITPQQFPMNMPGGFSSNMATGAHDPLHARTLVLDDGTTTLAMVVVDNLGAGPDILDEAKQIASEKTGIPTNRMLISSTHTHSGASASTSETAQPAVVAYHKVFVSGVAESIIKAHARLQPARIGAAAQPLPDEVFN